MIWLPRKLLAGTCLAFGLMQVVLPAEAYYWGYSPWGYARSSTWPLRAVAYSLRGGGYGFYPAYLASSLIGTALYYKTVPKPYMALEQYQDEEPLGSPRRRSRPKRPAVTTTDQIAKAAWSHPSVISTLSNEPNVLMLPSSQAPTLAVNAPLAEGFIFLVNSRFNGDIAAALFDPEARAWAKTIGFVSQDSVVDANLDSSRITIIKQIFQDDSLAPLKKLQTAHLLLQ